MKYLKTFENNNSDVQKHVYQEKMRISRELFKFFHKIDDGEMLNNGTYKGRDGNIMVSGVKPCNLYFNKEMESIFDIMIEWFKKDGLIKDWRIKTKNNILGYSKLRYQKVPNEFDSNHQYIITIPNIYIDDMLESVKRLSENDSFLNDFMVRREINKYNL